MKKIAIYLISVIVSQKKGFFFIGNIKKNVIRNSEVSHQFCSDRWIFLRRTKDKAKKKMGIFARIPKEEKLSDYFGKSIRGASA